MEAYKENSITYENGRYTAKLPWKKDQSPFPDNYDVCKKRTENTIRRLSQEPEMLMKYGQILENQLDRGFIEKVDTSIQPSYPTHYIPHHGVKKDSATTPIRIVYHCSCRQSRDKPRLNDCLLSTPPDLNDLTVILLRFRMHKYAAATDIEKAFLHVGLDEKDRDATRFLWLSDPNDPSSALKTYRFKTVLFGATCSPFILSATILKHLDMNKSKWVSEYLRKDLFVDNVISSFPRETELLQYYAESRDLMSSAGFNLRSWSSNSATLRAQAANDNVLDTDTCTKVLGMRWNSVKDILQFPDRKMTVTEITTKRKILQQTSRLYDPLGLLSPVTVRAKILLQELWQLKYDWDTQLPDDTREKWHSLVTDLNSVGRTTIQRHYFNNVTNAYCVKSDNVSLHIFCDASTTSYGATAYICIGDQSTLTMAKTRVAHLKKLTLPRLELMGAVVGARLYKSIQQSTGVSQIYLWSDGQIVLYWLQTAKTQQRFIHDRVAKIHELTENRKWRNCPTKDNPADLLTRGLSAKQFQLSDLWFKGPKWLNNRDQWPVWQLNDETVTMALMADTACNVTNFSSSIICSIPCFVDMSRFRTLSKLLRVTANVLRFIRNCRRGRSTATPEPLTADELFEAEKTCIRCCQKYAYSAELNDVKSNRNKLPLVKQLRLFTDDTGTLKCRGRIHNAPVHEMTKFPYLLPARHLFTRLVIRNAHNRLFHAGASSTNVDQTEILDPRNPAVCEVRAEKLHHMQESFWQAIRSA